MSKTVMTGFNALAEGKSALVPLAPLALEANDYLADLDGFDLTGAQKRELLETLWAILKSLVELGISVNVLDLVCGQNGEDENDLAASGPGAVGFPVSPNEGRRPDAGERAGSL